ncbi:MULTISPECIES: DUF6278 family protein [Streptomyces]|uniref:DUF6278 family protein n=1 Tax=Streptomyces evansiae TaxID=3075535 RepID=A0ABU2QYX1_9ACTN|nr:MULTISPECIES: DUF6278 family protein [unclassified Streptomyces]MDT0409652.1 DUF6278 family protein [Streptomyces sp. DSM 41979]MYQ60825.1 hypothetical protein [Streptomyces sp. SID4926]
MEFRLKYAPEPVNASLFAADIVRAAAEIDGVELDGTPGSLDRVDAVLERLRAEGVTTESVAATLFGFGCYTGEVLVRHGGGAWRAVTEEERAVFGWPLVVALPGGGVCNPIGKAFKRLENGPEDSLGYFYQVFTGAEPGSTASA